MTPVDQAAQAAAAPVGQLAHAAHALSGINWWAWDSHRPPMGWFLLDFALFVALLVFFAAGPLSRALAERHESIRRAVTDAAANHAKASANQHAWSRRLAGLDAEVRELESVSAKDGEAELARAVADAEERAQRLREESQILATQETRRTHERLRKRLLAEAIAQAEAQLSRNLSDEDQQRLLDQAIHDVPTAKKNFSPRVRAAAPEVRS